MTHVVKEKVNDLRWTLEERKFRATNETKTEPSQNLMYFECLFFVL